MAIPRGVTAVLTLYIGGKDLDLTQAVDVFVSLKPEKKQSRILKSGDMLTVGEKTIELELTQEESLYFVGKIEVQANWIDRNGGRVATNIGYVEMGRQLLDRPINL